MPVGLDLATVLCICGPPIEGTLGDLGFSPEALLKKGEDPLDALQTLLSEFAAQQDPAATATASSYSASGVAPVVLLNNVPQRYMHSAALFLQELNLPFIGTKPDYLRHSQEDLKMLAFYGEFAMGGFSVVDGQKLPLAFPSEKAVPFPRRLSVVTSPASLAQGRPGMETSGLKTEEEFSTEIKKSLKKGRKVMVDHDLGSCSDFTTVFSVGYLTGVDALNKKHPCSAVSTVTTSPAGTSPALETTDTLLAKCNEMTVTVLKTFAYHSGFVSCQWKIRPETKKKKNDEGVEVEETATVYYYDSCTINPTFSASTSFEVNVLAKCYEGGVSAWVKKQAEIAAELHRISQPTYKVSFDNEQTGYFIRAARDIPKGDCVFDDEGRTFTITTRPFVEKNWEEDDKIVFSRYAWPLDEGHVYVTWEESPKRWRPINHSCDPNCLFGENHSLHVYASRDIKEGDELTLDYATFCDFSMKPFNCFCGATSCRGKDIQPNQAALEKYGDRAWHRRMPSTAAGKV